MCVYVYVCVCFLMLVCVGIMFFRANVYLKAFCVCANKCRCV